MVGEGRRQKKTVNAVKHKVGSRLERPRWKFYEKDGDTMLRPGPVVLEKGSEDLGSGVTRR